MKADATITRISTLLDYPEAQPRLRLQGYKRASLMRRIASAMQRWASPTSRTIVDYLEVHPEEFAQLFNTILINVTGFLRDPPAWEFLRARKCFRDLLASKRRRRRSASGAPAAPRVRSRTPWPSCSPRRWVPRRSSACKIYATDVDEEALNEARQGDLHGQELEPRPAEWRERYFKPTASATRSASTCAAPSSSAATT